MIKLCFSTTLFLRGRKLRHLKTDNLAFVKKVFPFFSGLEAKNDRVSLCVSTSKNLFFENTIAAVGFPSVLLMVLLTGILLAMLHKRSKEASTRSNSKTPAQRSASAVSNPAVRSFFRLTELIFPLSYNKWTFKFQRRRGQLTNILQFSPHLNSIKQDKTKRVIN